MQTRHKNNKVIVLPLKQIIQLIQLKFQINKRRNVLPAGATANKNITYRGMGMAVVYPSTQEVSSLVV